MSAKGSARSRPAREGFALLTVLWVLASMVVLGILLHRTASEAIGAAQNRSGALRTSWEIEGCLARTLAAIDGELQGAREVEEAWNSLDRSLSEQERMRGCDMLLMPVGTTVDVNHADRTRLLALFVAAGIPYERADSMVAALDDWHDADDDLQRSGAERQWYHALGRPGPRNAPFAAREELRLVRGFESPSAIDDLISVEPGRILLARAQAPVLSTLPGFGEEAIARLLELRTDGPVHLFHLTASLSPGARAQLQAHQMELAQLATSSPDAWLITGRRTRAATGGTSSIELRVVRSGRRAAIMRHRSRPWS